MPTPADAIDTVAAEKLVSEKASSPSVADRPGGTQLPSDQDKVTRTEEKEAAGDSSELYENPFMKPPKRIRLRLLN